MSHSILATDKGNSVNFSSFVGQDRSRIYQITTAGGFVQLTRAQLLEIASAFEAEEKKLQEQGIENQQFVSANGNTIVVLRPCMAMTKREALVHAAWLVAMADDDETFAQILEAVQNT